jgi:hypothetical protein
MPTTSEQDEIIKMTAIADNEEQTPEVRILAARRLLRYTEFSARSVRVAKRIAKLYYANEDVSSVVRTKAASLLEFVLSKPEDDGSPLEPLTPAPAFSQDGKKDGPVSRKLYGGLITDQPWFGHASCECHPDVTVEKTIELERAAKEKFGPTEPMFQIVNGKKELTPAYIQARNEFSEAMDAAQQEAAVNKKISPQLAAKENPYAL